MWISASGQACREMELWDDRPWAEKWAEWRGCGFEFRRVDFAWDDFAGLLTMDAVAEAIERGGICTRAKVIQEFGSMRLGRGRFSEGRTIYVGDEASPKRLVFYDKAAEQGRDCHWVRMELRLKDRCADACVELLLKDGPGVLLGVVDGYCSFRDTAKRVAAKDAPKVGWWARATEGAVRIRLVLTDRVKTLYAKVRYLERSVAKTLAIVQDAGLEGDFVARLLALGRDRIGQQDRVWMDAENRSRGYAPGEGLWSDRRRRSRREVLAAPALRPAMQGALW